MKFYSWGIQFKNWTLFFPWDKGELVRLKEKLIWWIVSNLPKRILLYAFVYVYGYDGNGLSFKSKCDYFSEKHGLK